MDAEIFWTLDEDDEDAEVIPGKITSVRKVDRGLQVFFSGRHGYTRDVYEGVFTLQLRQGHQDVQGIQSFKEFGGEWESMTVLVSGAFQDTRCENFVGTWTERGTRLTVEVVGLPYFGKPSPSKKKLAVDSDIPAKRRLAKRSPRKR